MKTDPKSRQVETHHLKDDDVFPYNEELPLLIYSAALDIKNQSNAEGVVASSIENLLHSNKWGRAWQNGIYGFHHYHSTAHEVLCVYQGEAKVQLGGDDGIV